MRLIAHDGVPDIVEMRHLCAVKDDGVLNLTGIADNSALADDDAAP